MAQVITANYQGRYRILLKFGFQANNFCVDERLVVGDDVSGMANVEQALN